MDFKSGFKSKTQIAFTPLRWDISFSFGMEDGE